MSTEEVLKVQHDRRVFDSAVDTWIAVLLLLTPFASAAIGIALMFAQRFGDATAMFLCGAAAMALTALFTIPCRYTLLEDTLNMRCGVVCYSVPLDKIESVELSSSWLSGPALSLRRIRIVAAGKSYLISPKDRDEFLAVLRERIEIESGSAIVADRDRGE